MSVEVTGLRPLVAELRGPLFRDLNRELRHEAKQIAQTLVPVVAAAVAQSAAPQAAAVAATVRAHSDRVPVVVVGKTNPRGMRQRPGGRRDTQPHENYYRIGRDGSGGALGRSLASGPAFDLACEQYLRAFEAAALRHGFIGAAGNAIRWGG
jgi:hypothetical protein